MPRFYVIGFIAILFVVSTQTRAASYRLDIDNTWSTTTHPGNFPHDAHFSWFAGATHSDAVSFWELGQPVSPAMQQMAELGVTYMLESDISSEVSAGTADSLLRYRHWFCPDETTSGSCGPTTQFFDMDQDFPLVTLVSMIGPSPDWFVGVSGLPLFEDGQWKSQVVIDIRPYDAGTRDLNAFQLTPNDRETLPHAPASLITTESGQLIGPGSLGTMTFTLTSGLIGDLDGDGFVGINDLNVVLGNWNQSVPPADPSADPSGDGFVGIDDLNTVLSHWNDGIPPAAQANIPEPGSFALLGGLVVALSRRIHYGRDIGLERVRWPINPW